MYVSKFLIKQSILAALCSSKNYDLSLKTLN